MNRKERIDEQRAQPHAHSNTKTSLTEQRQEPLRARYREAPGEAWLIDMARSVHDRNQDPFHGALIVGERERASTRFGIHRALGGDHDLPNPGDFLCAALAGCFDATVRLIAERRNLRIDSLSVLVTAEADVRGALRVDLSVPVGFQRMTCRVRIECAEADAADVQAVIEAAEHCCVTLNTLRIGVPVRTLVESKRLQSAGS